MPERCVSCTKTSPSAHPAGRRSFIQGSHGENVRRNWLILAAAAATLLVLAYPVNNNIRYEVGVHRVSGYSIAETFSHRPLTFRFVSAAQSWLPTLASESLAAPGSLARAWLFEAGFRLVAALVAAAAAVLLTVGLRRRLGSAAWAYGLAAYAGLFFTAPATGEPDWWAAVVAVAAVGTALLARESTGGSMAGALLAVVALLKISSLPIALAAVMLIAAFDRRRALWALASAFVAGCLAVALIWWLAPYEIVWLLDIRAIQPAVWTAGTSAELREYLANLAARWPTVALLPAFFVGASRREVIAVGSATGLAVLGFVAQGQYYVYHAVPLVVLSAVLAVHTVRRSGAVLRRPVLVGIVVVAMLLVSSPDWRLVHTDGLFTATGVWVLALMLLQSLAVRAPGALPRAAVDRWAAGLVVAAMLASQTPWSAESLTLGTRDKTVMTNLAGLSAGLAGAERVRQVVGEGPVVYLTFGATTYLLGNPTRCRYPSPLFLQRPEALGRASAATRGESLACLTQPDARWLIWDRTWLHRKGAAPDLIATIDGTWNCERAVLVDGLTLCPRREQ